MKKLNDDELKKVDGGATRPMSHKKNISKKPAKPTKRRGSGLGTGRVGKK